MFEKIPLDAQLNVEADELASQTYDIVADTTQKSLACRAIVSVHEVTTTRNIKRYAQNLLPTDHAFDRVPLSVV
jgi:hypothetical protein